MIGSSSRVTQALGCGSIGVAQLLSVLGCLLTAACGATPAGEDTAVQQQDLGEAACATDPADITLIQSDQLFFVSPTTYSKSNCYKAYIVNLTNLPPNPTDVRFQYDGAMPNNLADCAATRLWVQEYEDNGTTFVATGPKQESDGSFCNRPQLTYFLDPSASTHRYAVSARSGGANGPTVKFLVED